MKKLNILLLSLLCYSCINNNPFYIDINSQTIVSENQSPIERVEINNLDTFQCFTVERNRKYKGEYNSNRISLKNIPPWFNIFTGWKHEKINNKYFKLLPNSNYSVERHGNNDAAPIEIKFRTDSMSNIINNPN